MTESLEEPVQVELVEQPQPPLSIGHLLLWIFGSAVVLWSYRWLGEPQGSGPLVFLIDQMARSATLGAGVAALVLFARRLAVRDAPLPRQPGHWILVIHGLVWPAYWIAMVSVYGLRGGEPGPRDLESFERYVTATGLFYLWGSALYFLALFGLREARRWRVYFALCAAAPLLHAVLSCCLLAGPRFYTLERAYVGVRIAALLSVLLICVLRDRRGQVRRDWLHFVGIACSVLGSLASLVMFGLQWAARQ